MPITTDPTAIIAENLFGCEYGWSTYTGPADIDDVSTWDGDLSVCRACQAKVWITTDQYAEMIEEVRDGAATAILCGTCDPRVDAMLAAMQISEYISTSSGVDLTDVVCLLEDISIEATGVFGDEDGNAIRHAVARASSSIAALVAVLDDIRTRVNVTTTT